MDKKGCSNGIFKKIFNATHRVNYRGWAIAPSTGKARWSLPLNTAVRLINFPHLAIMGAAYH
ncbi:MAG TPA: hypothetical protein DDW49_04490 [Deltaproteobacteria bacterium]|nr:MAG: hypothetical protein A2048_06655 [Deltaproteobacteria bacterium GWA2_45_12]HBF12638.1 hypothetical protein [Deltaproteobacteria bacterium]